MKAGKRLLALLICGALVGGNVLPVYAEKSKEKESIINEVDSTEEIEQSEVDVLDEQPIINQEPTEEEKSGAKEDVASEDEQEAEQFEQDNTRVAGENWLWPVKGCTTISSGYGYRTHPISGEWDLHKGIDIPAQIGTPIRATQSGYLVVKGYNQYRGNWSVIDHQNGTYSDYQHMSSYAISSNQWVNQGDIIGYVGSSGDVTGAHLHFEIRTGAVNQAGNYDSLTPVNTNKDSINYVYEIVKYLITIINGMRL